MKNGQSFGDAAKEVDDFLSGGTSAPAPKPGTRKFNPRTGDFD